MLSTYAEAVPKENVFPNEQKIKEYFSFYNLRDIIKKLLDNLQKCPVAQEILDDFDQSSPLSLRVNYDLMQRGKFLTLKECIELDYRLAKKFMIQKDFYEGINCKVINKGQKPNWEHKSLHQIPDRQIDEIFNRRYVGEELYLDEQVKDTSFYVELFE